MDYAILFDSNSIIQKEEIQHPTQGGELREPFDKSADINWLLQENDDITDNLWSH